MVTVNPLTSLRQVFNLLQKFLESSVIEDCKGSGCDTFTESSNKLYRFVRSPGPLNFLDDSMDATLGPTNKDDSVCFANSFALKGKG